MKTFRVITEKGDILEIEGETIQLLGDDWIINLEGKIKAIIPDGYIIIDVTDWKSKGCQQ